ncbi:IclR family transcriptional regulator [Budviciaceae bacterium BWR-B9]|uniref:IclR family transcriptional regulator n=1 Tax=Limnobaculum allomyrinae TaxID=2791986 RepID=A0ABS1IMM9_9GAMM|nr:MULTISPECIES: helix-turn-helix domain-containing protein [Limnobaculum]MBK5142993.1 IclR family transcriptional regulator [Limnobaculum allomyrinae]MBV7693322.1 IclR family transcriptional regulator [Limnobaculum sp. M2-1]
MKTTSTSGSRILKVLKAVKGYTLTGISNSAIAEGIDDSPSNVSRALSVLIEEGLVIKLDNGLFAHSIEMLRIAQAHVQHINNIQDRITETHQRIFSK